MVPTATEMIKLFYKTINNGKFKFESAFSWRVKEFRDCCSCLVINTHRNRSVVSNHDSVHETTHFEDFERFLLIWTSNFSMCGWFLRVLNTKSYPGTLFASMPHLKSWIRPQILRIYPRNNGWWRGWPERCLIWFYASSEGLGCVGIAFSAFYADLKPGSILFNFEGKNMNIRTTWIRACKYHFLDTGRYFPRLWEMICVDCPMIRSMSRISVDFLHLYPFSNQPLILLELAFLIPKRLNLCIPFIWVFLSLLLLPGELQFPSQLVVDLFGIWNLPLKQVHHSCTF